MGKVVGITPPNTRLVKLLEDLLVDAKRGRLTSLAAVVLRDHEADFALEVSDLSTLEIIGAMEVLKSELLSNQS
jgi:hypothetical protein